MGNGLADQRTALDLDDDEAALLVNAEKVEATCSAEVQLLLEDDEALIDQGGISRYPRLQILFEPDRSAKQLLRLRTGD